MLNRLIFITAAILLAAGPALAGMYKWVDENGVTHYGDKIPPQYAKQQREVINKQGTTVKVLPHEKTEAERQEEKRQEELKRLEREEAKNDRYLLQTYDTEADIEEQRDAQIASIDSFIKVMEMSISGTEKTLAELNDRAAKRKAEGKEPQEHVVKQISEQRARLDSDRKALDGRKQERAAIEARFTRDIARWKQLKGSAGTAAQASPATPASAAP